MFNEFYGLYVSSLKDWMQNTNPCHGNQAPCSQQSSSATHIFWHLTVFCLSHNSWILFSRVVIYSVSQTRSKQMKRCTRIINQIISHCLTAPDKQEELNKTPPVTLSISVLRLQVTHIRHSFRNFLFWGMVKMLGLVMYFTCLLVSIHTCLPACVQEEERKGSKLDSPEY